MFPPACKFLKESVAYISICAVKAHSDSLCVLSNYLTPVSPFTLHKFQDLLTSLPSHLHPIVKPNEYMKAVRKSHFSCVCTERQKLTGQ